MAQTPNVNKLRKELTEFQENIQPKIFEENKEIENEKIIVKHMYHGLLQYLKQIYNDVIIYKNKNEYFLSTAMYNHTLEFCILIKNDKTQKYDMFAVRDFFLNNLSPFVNNYFQVKTIKWDKFFNYNIDDWLPMTEIVSSNKPLITKTSTLRKKIHKLYQKDLYQKYYNIFHSLFLDMFQPIIKKPEIYQINRNTAYNIHLGVKSEKEYISNISLYPSIKGYKQPEKKLVISIKSINSMHILDIIEINNDSKEKVMINKKLKNLSDIAQTVDKNKETIMQHLKQYENDIENSKANIQISNIKSKMNEYIEEGKDPIEYLFTYLSYMYNDMFEFFEPLI